MSKVIYNLSDITLTVKDGKVTIESEDDDIVQELGPVETYLCVKDYKDNIFNFTKGETYKFRRDVGQYFFLHTADGNYIGDNKEWFHDTFIKVKED